MARKRDHAGSDPPAACAAKTAPENNAGTESSYVTDAGYTPDNIDKIIDLVDRSDLLFIESPFLHEDADIAKRKMHLTARQAGKIARRAHVRRFEQFHFSPRYEGRGGRLRQEGLAAFSGHEPVFATPD